MSLLFRRMPYVTRSRHGVWKYRRAIPEPLRARAGKREIIVSLGTKDEREAELKSLRVHEDTESLLRAWTVLEGAGSAQRGRGAVGGRGGASGASSSRTVASVVAEERDAVDDWYQGLEFLKTHGLPYRPSQRDMVEYELEAREAIVSDQLGIDLHHPDVEIDHSPEAKALLGLLKKPDPTFDEALKVYLRLKEGRPRVSGWSPSASGSTRSAG